MLANYLDDAAYLNLQNELMTNRQAGDVIEGMGGLRKLRQEDPAKAKAIAAAFASSTTGGWEVGNFWLFTVYDKDQPDDLTPEQRKTLKRLLDTERQHRQPKEFKP